MIAGPALPITLSLDDNLGFRMSLEGHLTPGVVPVMAGATQSRAAVMGGLVALEVAQFGVPGFVTDGLIRDVKEIRQWGLGIWARGVTPMAPNRNGPGSVGGQVTISGILVREGDIVIADDDGVTIWPREQAAEILEKATARYKLDEERMQELLARQK